MTCPWRTYLTLTFNFCTIRIWASLHGETCVQVWQRVWLQQQSHWPHQLHLPQRPPVNDVRLSFTATYSSQVIASSSSVESSSRRRWTMSFIVVNHSFHPFVFNPLIVADCRVPLQQSRHIRLPNSFKTRSINFSIVNVVVRRVSDVTTKLTLQVFCSCI